LTKHRGSIARFYRWPGREVETLLRRRWAIKVVPFCSGVTYKPSAANVLMNGSH